MPQVVKNLPGMQETRVNLWVEKVPWRREWQPTPVLLPRKSLGQRSLVGYSLWDQKEWDMAEWLTLWLLTAQRQAKNLSLSLCWGHFKEMLHSTLASCLVLSDTVMAVKLPCTKLWVTNGVVAVQLLIHVWLFVTPWITACQASLSFTISWTLLKLMSSESW